VRSRFSACSMTQMRSYADTRTPHARAAGQAARWSFGQKAGWRTASLRGSPIRIQSRLRRAALARSGARQSQGVLPPPAAAPRRKLEANRECCRAAFGSVPSGSGAARKETSRDAVGDPPRARPVSSGPYEVFGHRDLTSTREPAAACRGAGRKKRGERSAAGSRAQRARTITDRPSFSSARARAQRRIMGIPRRQRHAGRPD